MSSYIYSPVTPPAINPIGDEPVTATKGVQPHELGKVRSFSRVATDAIGVRVGIVDAVEFGCPKSACNYDYGASSRSVIPFRPVIDNTVWIEGCPSLGVRSDTPLTERLAIDSSRVEAQLLAPLVCVIIP